MVCPLIVFSVCMSLMLHPVCCWISAMAARIAAAFGRFVSMLVTRQALPILSVAIGMLKMAFLDLVDGWLFRQRVAYSSIAAMLPCGEPS